VSPAGLVLGIESSCDEMAAAVVRDGREILASVVHGQTEVHAPYGGVVPELASRDHVRVVSAVTEQALEKAGVALPRLDGIAVTAGPGLLGSLLVGLSFAKALAFARGLPIVGVHHLVGHLISAELADPTLAPPYLGFVVSGGHTALYRIEGPGQPPALLGETRDDAAGEAFDKVGRLLGLPYPGGPSIESAAQSGNPNSYKFPRAWLEGTWDFSFSGLKTAVLYEVKKQHPGRPLQDAAPLDVAEVPNLAASFQAAIVDALVGKTVAAAEQFKVTEIFVAGGVSANTTLKAEFDRRAKVPVRVPPLILCTDNAAMIAAAGNFRYLAGQRDALDMDVIPNWRLV
jgi:N6-L-threonylcarbamoyladenine synthase